MIIGVYDHALCDLTAARLKRLLLIYLFLNCTFFH